MEESVYCSSQYEVTVQHSGVIKVSGTQLVTSQSRTEGNEDLHASYSAHLLHSLGHKPREWCFPQWTESSHIY